MARRLKKKNGNKNNRRISEPTLNTGTDRRGTNHSRGHYSAHRFYRDSSTPQLHQFHGTARIYWQPWSSSVRIRCGNRDLRTDLWNHGPVLVSCNSPTSRPTTDLGRTGARLLDPELLRLRRVHHRRSPRHNRRDTDSAMETTNTNATVA